MNAPRVEFEATLEDLIDCHVRFLRRSSSARSWRRTAVALAGAAGGMAVFLFWLVDRSSPGIPALVLAAACSTLLGVGLALAYGLIYDRGLRRRLERLLREQLGGTESFRCEIELRAEGAWFRQRNVEVLLPWSELTGIEDAAYGIALWFQAGFVVARERAFPTAAQREAFLCRARELGGAPPGSR